MKARHGLVAFAVFAMLTLATAVSMARPGGGSGYHGRSGGSSGGGYHGGSTSGGYHGGSTSWGGSGPSSPSPTGPSYSGDGGGSGLGFLSLLAFGCLVLLPLFLALARASQRNPQPGWSTEVEPPRPAAPRYPIAPGPKIRPRRVLEKIRKHDPGFSLVVFEDFLYALYAELHTARGKGQVALFSAYVSPPVLARLAAKQGGGVRDVIIGAMHFQPAPEDGDDNARVEFEANYTEQEQSFYVRETWLLSRAKGTKSRPPESARIFNCPSCGAAQDAVMAGTCSFCKQIVATGAFDWVVKDMRVSERTSIAPVLTGNAPEEGTDLLTHFAMNLDARLVDLGTKDPAFDLEGFERRVRFVFFEFQTAWAARDLAAMRPLMSDGLFDIETYWVKTYVAQGLRNVTEKTSVTKIETVRVTSDAHYDAVTVRLFATGLDYTLRDSDGARVGGSQKTPRSYSEYWTFIRGAARSGPARTEPTCPNCGAALKVNMAGTCEYCQAHVTRGEFDWVLSRIEQDESYEG